MEKEKLDLSVFSEEEREKVEGKLIEEELNLSVLTEEEQIEIAKTKEKVEKICKNSNGYIKNALIVGLSTMLVATILFGLSRCLQIDPSPIETGEQTSAEETTEFEWSTEDWEKEGDYYVVGEPVLSGGYYTYSQEDVMKMAQNSIDRIENMFAGRLDITRYGSDKKAIPAIIDKEFLTAIAMQESSFRSVDKNGDPVASSKQAYGLMQITQIGVNYLVSPIDDEGNPREPWLEYMGIDDKISISLEDAKDPQKSMDVALLMLLANYKNYADSKDEEIFSYVEFNEVNQKATILSLYYGTLDLSKSKSEILKAFSSGSYAMDVLEWESLINQGQDLQTYVPPQELE